MTRFSNKASFSVRKHTVDTAGVPEHLGGFMIASTISYATNVISDSGSGFITKGFKSGDKVVLSGSTSNDGTYTVVTVAAGTFTLESGVVLTTEIAGDVTTISAAVRAPQDVDDGIKVVVRAHPDNTGNVFVGNSSANALSTSNNNQPLAANSTTSMQVKDLRAIWVDTATGSNSVLIQYEA